MASGGEKPEKGFEFVVQVNTVARNAETRRKVRSHARRQQPQTSNSNVLPVRTAPGAVRAQKDLTTKFKLVSANATAQHTVRRKDKKRTSPRKEQPEDDGAAPKSPRARAKAELARPNKIRELPILKVLPVEMTERSEELLNFYYKTWLANSFALNPEGTWFDSIKKSPPALHAFFSAVSAMHNAAYGLEDEWCPSYHSTLAVTLINNRLKTEGQADEPVSDDVLVAVSLLVHSETLRGNYTASLAHYSGMRQIVKMRGGMIEGLGSSLLLQRAVSWADFAFATAWGTNLTFPLIPRMAHSMGIRDRFLTRSSLGDGSSGLAVRERSVLELVENIWTIVDGINTFDIMATPNRLKLSNAIYLLEYRLCETEERLRARSTVWPEGGSRVSFQDDVVDAELLSLANDVVPLNEDGSPAPPTADLSEALLYATHIFLHICIRGQPAGSLRHRHMIERLWQAIWPVLERLDLIDPAPLANDSILNGPPLSLLGADLSPVTSSAASSASPASSDITLVPSGCPQPFDVHESLLIWILFIGCVVRCPPAAAGPSFPGSAVQSDDSSPVAGSWYDRGSFVYALKMLSRQKGIASQEDLRSQLKEVIWVKGGCDHLLDRLAREILLPSTVVATLQPSPG
jgi:hypothetical protein